MRPLVQSVERFVNPTTSFVWAKTANERKMEKEERDWIWGLMKNGDSDSFKSLSWK